MPLAPFFPASAPPTLGGVPPVPPSWRRPLAGVAGALESVCAFVESERGRGAIVYPPRELTLAALERTALEDVKVVIVGQDPYHGPGEAHGLSFSVPQGVRVPPSLRNIHRELQSDLGFAPPTSGDLTPWAERGVLLLNTVLTVRKDEPASHRGAGWQAVTDAILQRVNEKDERVVFLLLGADAQKLGARIHQGKHAIVARSHPSPLAARRGFLGTRPFSAVNDALCTAGRAPIDWRLA
jgi:uracil-DNA glycosylase